MTCIVGVIDKTENKVWIGGDSAGVSGLDVTIRKDPKVFKVGEFLIGCTSSFRMIQLLMFKFRPAKISEGQDIFEYMCTDVIDSIRQCLKNGGFAEKEKEVESGGTFLIGFRGRLFRICNDYQVGECEDSFDSVGCAQDYARGYLKGTNGLGLPEYRINKALEIATHFSGGVRPPFIILSL